MFDFLYIPHHPIREPNVCSVTLKTLTSIVCNNRPLPMLLLPHPWSAKYNGARSHL